MTKLVDSHPGAARPLHVVQYLPGIRLEQGGVVRAVLDACAVACTQGHRVTLFTYQPKDVPAEWLAGTPGVPHAIVLPAPTLPGQLLSRAAIAAVSAVLNEADVLHLHAPWLNGNRQLARAARRMRVPYVVTLHGMLDDWSMVQRGLKKRLYMRLLGRRFLDHAAAVHCTAAAECDQARKWFDNPRTLVLPCIIDLGGFAELPGPEAGLALLPPEQRSARKILFLSRLHEKKGVDTLLRAAALLRADASLPPFVVVLAGTGDLAYQKLLRDLVAEMQLESVVSFVGLVTGPVKASLYQGADVFALPTKQENFGLVLVEALACGVPIVTTRGTDVWQELQAAGGQIAEATPAAFADALRAVLQMPAEQRVALGQQGRRWVLSTFNATAMAQAYETLYRSAIEAN